MALDSRRVQPGFLFAALPGSRHDGGAFIPNAIEAGATVILCQMLPTQLHEEVTYLVAEDVAEALGIIASAYYGEPSRFVELVGVTGTNGKTSVATLLWQLFTELGFKCGLISTAGNFIDREKREATHTTPNAIALNALLMDMVEAEMDYVFMEVSSHAVAQKRIAGLQFRLAAFTNLTHDHLDYHKTFSAYRDAKKAFFDNLDNDAIALTNADDKNGRYMLQNTRATRMTYALENYADFKGKIIEQDIHGMVLQLDGSAIELPFSGVFNAYNLTCVYAIGRLLGFSIAELLGPLSKLHQVNGRFNVIGGGDKTAVIDYAHTPDALENVLRTIEQINVGGKKVITVIGCGGNRDAAKRPLMAKIAADMSHKVILTSDNPRDEDPETILDEMEAGLSKSQKEHCLRITDRQQAIKAAVQLAARGDIILIAGKGHETYQEIAGVKHPFDDREVVTRLLGISTTNPPIN